MLKPWIIWMIFAAILLIAEIFTAGFFLLWFGIAAGVAAFVALTGLGAPFQWGVFVVLSIVLFIISRPLAERLTKQQPPGIGADRFIGKKGIVVEEINPELGTGMVRIKSDEWRADSSDGQIIPKEQKIEVIGVDGTHLIVKKSV
ncbi:NfeD family protein [Candidatus Sumerlaeota bacterium]|nr:NfeD family protein [Candidatus Sumerlaeota bacterium]